MLSKHLLMNEWINSHLPNTLQQGSPTPRPWTCIGPWLVRNGAAQQEVSGGRVSKASSVFTATPHCSHYCLSSVSCQHHGELYNYFIIYYNVIIIEIKCTINVMHVNHSETIPTPSVEKLSSMKLVSGAEKVGDHCTGGKEALKEKYAITAWKGIGWSFKIGNLVPTSGGVWWRMNGKTQVRCSKQGTGGGHLGWAMGVGGWALTLKELRDVHMPTEGTRQFTVSHLAGDLGVE